MLEGVSSLVASDLESLPTGRGAPPVAKMTVLLKSANSKVCRGVLAQARKGEQSSIQKLHNPRPIITPTLSLAVAHMTTSLVDCAQHSASMRITYLYGTGLSLVLPKVQVQALHITDSHLSLKEHESLASTWQYDLAARIQHAEDNEDDETLQ